MAKAKRTAKKASGTAWLDRHKYVSRVERGRVVHMHIPRPETGAEDVGLKAVRKAPRKVATAVNRVLRKRMGPYGFVRATVSSGVDHDGDEVLVIDARYKYQKRPVDVRATVGLTSELREVLETLGEDRFPHVHHRFDDRQSTAKSA